MKRLKQFFFAAIITLTAFVVFPNTAKAAGKYYIKVNLDTCVTTAYKNNGTPVRAMISSPGYPTAPGTYYTPAKYRWKALLGDSNGPSYGQYSTRIYGGVLFHSVYYWQNGNKASMHVPAYNDLGQHRSHGCIRLLVKDAKWIYDNCPLGTKVIIGHFGYKGDPLGKPTFQRIGISNYVRGYGCNWDPTDPDPHNPFRKKAAKPAKTPVIKYTKAKTLNYKSSFNIKSGLSVTDGYGKSIISNAKITGKVNTSKLGTYKVKVSVSYRGKSASTYLTFKVVDTSAPVITGVKKSYSAALNQTYNFQSGVKASTKSKNLTSSIKLYYKSAGKYHLVKNGQIKFIKAGKWPLKYVVTGNNKSKTTYSTAVITDQRVILTAKNQTIEYGTKVDASKFVKITDYKKKASKANTVTYQSSVNPFKLGTYKITYTGKNGKLDYTKASKTISVTIVNNTRKPVVTVNNAKTNLEYINDQAHQVNLLDGIAAYVNVDKALIKSGKQDLTKSITVYDKNGKKIADPKNYTFAKDCAAGEYTFTYKVSVPGSKNQKLIDAKSRTYTVVNPVTIKIDDTDITTTYPNGQDQKVNLLQGVTAYESLGKGEERDMTKFITVYDKDNKLISAPEEYLFAKGCKPGKYTFTYKITIPGTSTLFVMERRTYTITEAETTTVQETTTAPEASSSEETTTTQESTTTEGSTTTQAVIQ